MEDIVRKLRCADELAAEGKASEEIAAELERPVDISPEARFSRSGGGLST